MKPMKPSEFFEKYYRVIVNDKPVPINLREEEKQIMDIADEMNVDMYIRSHGRRSSLRWIVNPVVIDEIQKRKNLNTLQ